MTTLARRRRTAAKHAQMPKGGKQPGSGRPKGTIKGRKPQLCFTFEPELADFIKKQPKGYVERLVAEDKRRQEEGI